MRGPFPFAPEYFPGNPMLSCFFRCLRFIPVICQESSTNYRTGKKRAMEVAHSLLPKNLFE